MLPLPLRSSALARAALLCFAMGLVAAGGRAAPFDVSHAGLTRVLAATVKNGQVDYAQLKAEPAGLVAYLDELARVERVVFNTWPVADRLAFLFNAYNAVTLKLIIDHHPVRSIKDIGSLFRGPWDQPVVRLFGQVLTLNTLEHGILRKEYQEPRLHVALVCAARGCPSLRAEAFVGSRLEEQLVDQMRGFLATSSKNRIDPAARTVHLSPIFKWYGGDFGSQPNAVLTALRPYWPDPAAAAASLDFTVRYTDYDWTLNDRSR
ncbi:MAG TPA: DUF547 domain-containing protein [Opitutaceae bacterium]|jgi:hypothetical protein|nr:DUF547 domain-containing protein [Opitutaceae bacterium]HRE08575.1 DUF547 domain-containing protein [Opitutaceae bacterium]